MWHQCCIFNVRQLLHVLNFIAQAKRYITVQQGSRGEVGRTEELRYLFQSASVLKEELQLNGYLPVWCVLNYLAILTSFVFQV